MVQLDLIVSAEFQGILRANVSQAPVRCRGVRPWPCREPKVLEQLQLRSMLE